MWSHISCVKFYRTQCIGGRRQTWLRACPQSASFLHLLNDALIGNKKLKWQIWIILPSTGRSAWEFTHKPSESEEPHQTFMRAPGIWGDTKCLPLEQLPSLYKEHFRLMGSDSMSIKQFMSQWSFPRQLYHASFSVPRGDIAGSIREKMSKVLTGDLHTSNSIYSQKEIPVYQWNAWT